MQWDCPKNSERTIASSRLLVFLISFLSLLGTRQARAYHHFIGYGYTACITCHYNGAGGGALNDYGRALFAAELTARWVIPKSVSDDKLGETSRFLGFANLPYWFRPAIKYRALSLEQNPGSESKTKRWIPMQREVYLTLAADQDNKYIFVGSMTQNSPQSPYQTSTQNIPEEKWRMKEAYLRAQLNDTSWLYLGQIDKVFGIREINHTAFSRSAVDIRQYDQSQGLIYQRSNTAWEFFVGAFTGNGNELPENRYKGASTMMEYEPFEKYRMGFSFLTEKNDSTDKNAIAIHQRLGLGKGNALSTEIGVVENKNLLVSGSLPTRPAYGLLQSFVRLDRGLNFLGELEWYRPDTQVGGDQIWRWNLGFLIFPLPRFELRAGAVNTRIFSSTSGNSENWALETQIHWSL